MAYQIAKEIGAMATVLKGDVDAQASSATGHWWKKSQHIILAETGMETLQEPDASPVDENVDVTLQVAIVVENMVPQGRIVGREPSQHIFHRITILQPYLDFPHPNELSQDSEELHLHDSTSLGF